jgi:hypothetical protein
MTGHESASNRPRRRWLLWSSLALNLLLIACVVMLWLAMPGRLERGYNRIQPGMAADEVDAILGEPFDIHFLPTLIDTRAEVWREDDVEVYARFDRHDRLIDSHFSVTDKPSTLGKIRRRLRSWLGW